MAQVAQIDITPQSTFEMIPVIGDHIVALGTAEDLDKKFSHLYTFYRQAWMQNGMNTYEKLDVQYNNQVVAVKKGTGKAQIDSARAHLLMQNLMATAQPGMVDSSNAIKPPPVKTVAMQPAKDSVKIRESHACCETCYKTATKRNSVSTLNNKAGKKTLTNGKKQKPKQIVKKKPGGKTRQPKAVLKK
jgi:cell division protein FtsQ